MAQMTQEWLDAEVTAASLQITKATLYKLIRDGWVPARKVGGRWRVSSVHIDELFTGVAPVMVAPERKARR
jgi:excisionase family DNA binding protein